MFKRAAVLAALLLIVGGVAASAKIDHKFHTIRTNLVDKTGGTATGHVLVLCNGGFDADRVVVHASGLQPGATYTIFWADSDSHKRDLVGPKPGTVVADPTGSFRYAVQGRICPVGKWDTLNVVKDGIVVLSASVLPGKDDQ